MREEYKDTIDYHIVWCYASLFMVIFSFLFRDFLVHIQPFALAAFVLFRVASQSQLHALSARGSLLTRSLADIVKKEDFVLDSEYLVTMLVVVPK